MAQAEHRLERTAGCQNGFPISPTSFLLKKLEKWVNRYIRDLLDLGHPLHVVPACLQSKSLNGDGTSPSRLWDIVRVGHKRKCHESTYVYRVGFQPHIERGYNGTLNRYQKAPPVTEWQLRRVADRNCCVRPEIIQSIYDAILKFRLSYGVSVW